MAEAQAGPLGTGGAAANPPIPQVIPEKPEGRSVSVGIRKAMWIALLTGLSVLFLYPFVWLFSASFKPRQDVSTTTFTFAPSGAGTEVTWTMDGRKDFMSKAVCMVMDLDKMVGGDFEKGLAQLKTVSETQPVAVPAVAK